MEKIKSVQDQALAAWIGELNKGRRSELLSTLMEEDLNVDEALRILSEVSAFIASPEKILGSAKSKHGEIAEQLHVNISNARTTARGLVNEFTFDGVGRTAAEDYLKNGMPVQSKFYVGSGGRQSILAIKEHLKKYPNFISNGGEYDIPKDQYKEIIKVLGMNKSELTIKQKNLVDLIKELEKSEGIVFKDKVKSSVINYNESQLNRAGDTIMKEENRIKEASKNRKNDAYMKSKPSYSEAAKVTGVSAVAEGGFAFAKKVYQKKKEGKSISEFTADDWKEIGLDTGVGGTKGAIRGASVYGLTNCMNTPAPVATSLVTATFGVVALAKKHQEGNLETEEFLDQSQMLCVDASVSAVSASLGQAIIPVPILGAVIGSVAGEYLYGIAKDHLKEEEQQLLKEFRDHNRKLNEKLSNEHKLLLSQLEKDQLKLDEIIAKAFEEDINVVMEASIELAEYVGVDESKILRTLEDIDDYFLS